MRQPRLCVFTQTPPVRFLREVPPAGTLSAYQPGVDYEHSPGGVTRMVDAFLGRLTENGRVGEAHWIALARHGPGQLAWRPGVRYHQARLPEPEMRQYAAAKAALWDAIHGLPREGPPMPRAQMREGFRLLARAMAARAREAHAKAPIDLFYVHDFQLMEVASELPPEVPRAFRWHIPVPETFDGIEYVVERLNEHDAVVVSTRAYAGALRRAGVTVPVHALPPYVNERRRRVVNEEDVAAFERRWGIGHDDVVFLLVARMDPMKSQDVAVRALARLRDPRARLVLVGGGGFSGARRGSLGLPTAARWREHVERVAEELGVRDRVVFTGNLPDADLDVAITRARAVLLPSRVEGFGLAAVEGWLYGRPVLVSRGAGVAEMVREGRNGFSFDPGDDAALAEHMSLLLDEPDLARRMGEEGRVAARACHLARGSEGVWGVLRPLIGAAPARADVAERP